LERLCGARGRRLAVWPVRHPGRDVCTRRAALPHLRCRAAGSGAQLRRTRGRKPRPPALARRSGGGTGSHPGGRRRTMKGNVVKRARAGSLIVLLASAAGAGAEVYDLPPPGTDVIGAVTTVEARAADTLLDIGRRHGVGYEEIVRANPDVDVWLPGEGTRVVLPTRYILPPGPRRGVVLNLPEYRLYYFPEPKPGEPAVVMTYPVSIGRMDWATPLGETRIVSKVVKPSWYPPESVRKEHAEEGRPLP